MSLSVYVYVYFCLCLSLPPSSPPPAIRRASPSHHTLSTITLNLASFHSKGISQPEAVASEPGVPKVPSPFPKCRLFFAYLLVMKNLLIQRAAGTLSLPSLLMFGELYPHTLGLYLLPEETVPSIYCSYAGEMVAVTQAHLQSHPGKMHNSLQDWRNKLQVVLLPTWSHHHRQQGPGFLPPESRLRRCLASLRSPLWVGTRSSGP